MSNTLIFRALLATAIAVGLTACSSSAPSSKGSVENSPQLENASLKPVAIRRAAPSFELKDANGDTAQLADYKGKVVLLNFWATWCSPCKAEMPWFEEFDKKFKDRGFAVLGVSVDEEGWNAVKPYVKEKNFHYRMLLSTEAVSTLYGGVDSLPTTFIIDKDGKIAAVHTGLVAKAVYQKQIEDLLETKNGALPAGDGAAEQLAYFRSN
ncbi:MAG: TlpA disulfide reductase family protein [Acidobacteriota bacterium]